MKRLIATMLVSLSLAAIPLVSRAQSTAPDATIDIVGTAVAAGVAVGGGGAGTAMQNQKGVVMKLRSTTEGVDLRFALEGVSASVVAP